MPLFFLLLFIHSAFGGSDPDRFASVHVNKKCGPIPWEAFAAQSYNAGGTSSTDAGGGLTVDPAKSSGTAEGNYGRDKTMNVAGANYELPMTGDQWVSMYLVYMNCVVKIESEELNPTAMWKDVVHGGLLKNVDDVRTFMTSTAALTNPAADQWWDEIKKLIKTNVDDNATVTTASFAKDQEQIDDLYKQIKDLREKYVQLNETVQTLREEVAGLSRVAADDDELRKQIKHLEERVDKLSDLLLDTREEIKGAASTAEATE